VGAGGGFAEGGGLWPGAAPLSEEAGEALVSTRVYVQTDAIGSIGSNAANGHAHAHARGHGHYDDDCVTEEERVIGTAAVTVTLRDFNRAAIAAGGGGSLTELATPPPVVGLYKLKMQLTLSLKAPGINL
jgi:hypothetical protein